MTWQWLTNCVYLLQNTPSGIQAHEQNSCNNSLCGQPLKDISKGEKKTKNKNGCLCFQRETFSLAQEWLIKALTDLLSAGLQQVPQMFHQLRKCGSVSGTVQPAVQHDLISTEGWKWIRTNCWDSINRYMLRPPQPPVLHLSGGVFWRPHPRALLKPPAERLINAHARIRRSPCRRRKWPTMNTLCLAWGLFILVITDRERRSPTKEPQRTRHRFAWCTPDQRWSQGPSTSEEGVPGGTEGSHVLHLCC